MMGSWGSKARLGDRAAMFAAATGLLVAVFVAVAMWTGVGMRRTLIDDAPAPPARSAAFAPGPQSIVSPAPDPSPEIAPPAAPPAASADAPPVVADPGPTPADPPPADPPPADPPPADPPPAAAPDTTRPSSSGDRVEQALALITYDWRNELPGWTLEISGARRGLLGLTTTAKRSIEIFVRPSMSVDELAHVIAHEIGHAVDLTHLDADKRREFQVIRGRTPRSPWWAADAQTDVAANAGDWAEAFAYTFTAGRGRWASQLGSPPTDAQQAALRALLH